MSPALDEGAPLCVSVVEDDEVIRMNLAHRISSDPAFRVLNTFADAETAVENLPSTRPNVVLMDINLPGMDGVECVRVLKPKMPEVYFLMLTVYEDGNRLFKSLMAGASGYLLKRTSPEKLLAAIREVCSGGAPMTPEIARRVVQHFQLTPEADSDLQKLSPRETDVLVNLSKGFTYKEIAEKLGITTGTLQGYISNVYQKLHVHSRTEAVVKYLNRSIAEPERSPSQVINAVATSPSA